MRSGYISFAIVTLMLAANLPAAADESRHWLKFTPISSEVVFQPGHPHPFAKPRPTETAPITISQAGPSTQSQPSTEPTTPTTPVPNKCSAKGTHCTGTDGTQGSCPSGCTCRGVHAEERECDDNITGH
jgi:hypothetical protein